MRGNDVELKPDAFKLTGLYKRTGPNTADFTPGKLVDELYYKYVRLHTPPTKESLKETFVQKTHDDDSDEHTKDGLGKDAKGSSILKDSEYQLDSGEYLLINYTNSKTNENGEEIKTVHNEYYGEGKIIKPNFGLISSELYHSNHSYSKRDGFDFSDKGVANPDGMFTLGPNEQIAIRDIVKVELDQADSYIYWSRNDDDNTKTSIEFTFNEYYGPQTAEDEEQTPQKYNAYTLKDGEYVYYTDSKKQSMAYYGAGSIIVKGDATPVLKKLEKVEVDKLLENGLDAIPWGRYNLSAKDGGLTIIENKYVTLTEGDEFYGVADQASSNPDNVGGIALSNDWLQISGAKYRFAEDEDDSSLPILKIRGISWSARSRLDFNMSPTKAQPLNERDSIEVTYSESDTSETIKPDAGQTLSVYSNYVCQAASHELNAFGIDDLSVKIVELDAPKVMAQDENKSYALNIGNYVSGAGTFTRFDFADISEIGQGKEAFTLNINLPSNQDEYGLIMFHYISPNYNASTACKIKAFDENDNEAGCIKVFNDGTGSYENTITLSAGVQTIQLKHGITKLTVYPDANFEDTIIFSAMSVVKGINPDLMYSKIDTCATDELDQLLIDIRDLGEDVSGNFYYSMPIDGTTAIDLHPTETLMSPEVWYDPNNVNNKFVISEISAEDLAANVTLTKSSRV